MGEARETRHHIRNPYAGNVPSGEATELAVVKGPEINWFLLEATFCGWESDDDLFSMEVVASTARRLIVTAFPCFLAVEVAMRSGGF